MLRGTLDVESDDAVTFRLTVENQGASPVELEFSDAQAIEVVVTEDDREQWRYGATRAFAQMLRSETLPAGDSTAYEAVWEDPDPGEYTAVATLQARNHDCEAEATFDYS